MRRASKRWVRVSGEQRVRYHVRTVHVSSGACYSEAGGYMASLAQAGDDMRLWELLTTYARGVEQELCIHAMY